MIIWQEALIRLESVVCYTTKGISARLLKIDRPNLRYVLFSSFNKKDVKSVKPANSRVGVESILNPFLRYFSVKRLSLNHAYVTIDDKSMSDPVTYKLNDFNFFATGIWVNRQTGKEWTVFRLRKYGI